MSHSRLASRPATVRTTNVRKNTKVQQKVTPKNTDKASPTQNGSLLFLRGNTAVPIAVAAKSTKQRSAAAPYENVNFAAKCFIEFMGNGVT